MQEVEVARVGDVRRRREDPLCSRQPHLVPGRSVHRRPAHQAGVRSRLILRHVRPADVEAERRAPARRPVLRDRADVGVERVGVAGDPRQRDVESDRGRLQRVVDARRRRGGRRPGRAGGPGRRRPRGGVGDVVLDVRPDQCAAAELHARRQLELVPERALHGRPGEGRGARELVRRLLVRAEQERLQALRRGGDGDVHLRERARGEREHGQADDDEAGKTGHREVVGGAGRPAVPQMGDTSGSSRPPAARTRSSRPKRATSCTEAGAPCSADPAGQRERRPAERRERIGEPDQRLPDVEVSDAAGAEERGDDGQRRGEEQVEPGECLLDPLAVLGAQLHRPLHLGVADGEAALQLDPHVLAVEVGVLREELPVDVGDLAHEARVAGAVRERQLDRAAAREVGGGRLDPGAHQRVGPVDPGDPDGELVQRAELERRVGGRELGQKLLAGRDARRHRARDVEARRERPAAVDGDEPVRRLVPDDPAAGGGDPDRAGRVGAERRVGEPGRERGRGAAARAARDAPGRRRVRHRPVVRVLGRRPVGELVQVRLPVHVPACVLEQRNRGGRPLRHVPGEERRPVGRLQSGRVEQVLDREPTVVGEHLGPGDEDRVEVHGRTTLCFRNTSSVRLGCAVRGELVFLEHKVRHVRVPASLRPGSPRPVQSRKR